MDRIAAVIKNMKTILITGASSGIGKATALHFAARGWRVIATMRDPSKSPFGGTEGISVIPLDVTDPESVRRAVVEARKISDRIEVLLNNAGYGLRGIFEAYTPGQIDAQFSTNVFGLIDVVRAFLPALRAQGGGTIINVSSVGGRIGFPLYSLYQASKFAVEGFTEALAYELEAFGIKLKLIEPGFIRTDFHTRSMDLAEEPDMPEYRDFAAKSIATQSGLEKKGSPPEKAARVIYRAATSQGSRLRYAVGSDAKLVLFLRSVVPFRVFRAIFKKFVIG
jgi:NAD(P)-dependent dehydrogenase (short-subunit alcohol dehydrogenase family)